MVIPVAVLRFSRDLLVHLDDSCNMDDSCKWCIQKRAAIQTRLTDVALRREPQFTKRGVIHKVKSILYKFDLSNIQLHACLHSDER